MSIKNFHIPIIAISIIIALLSNYGSFLSVIEPFTFLKMDINSLERGYINFFTLESTYNINNEWWRLITPMLIHFSFAHLVFNCLWIYVLGSKIEQFDGHLIFINLILFCSICSNLTQYFFGGPSLFGGLSGVIYGMLGFCMIIELESQFERYDLPPALYLFMIVWLVLGFMGVLTLFGFGNVANFAHLGGLISGIIFAMIINVYKRNII
ncbi:rhomboid family intramembrane serine protease [Gammaproteobacteria bacterium]|nr:rhomboid family intramembrane serine protease [Gammaproteobacteria bacterium]